MFKSHFQEKNYMVVNKLNKEKMAKNINFNFQWQGIELKNNDKLNPYLVPLIEWFNKKVTSKYRTSKHRI